MTKILLIAGHGENLDGSFDPGAIGFISKGEHKYYEQDFFPAVKKYLPDDNNVVFFSDYNVFNHRDLITLAKKYGKDTIVIEMHYDGGDKSASGGHVVVHADFAPDKYDLAIRNVIKNRIGVRYNHKGNVGISGRTNLYNCNLAAKNGINYRLVELGFGSNILDSTKMVKNVDGIAKDFVEALLGKSKEVETVKTAAVKPVVQTVSKPAAQPAAQPKKETKSIATLAQEVIDGKLGSGDARKKALGNQYDAVQAKVNEMLGAKPKVAAKSIDTLANETIAGKHGSGDARKKSLGTNYDAVQKRVNELLGAKKSTSKSLNTIADEVLKGKWGNNPERSKKLKAAGYNPDEVQKLVNKKL